MTRSQLKILLIEDDEDDYILVKDLLSQVRFTRFDLDWVETYEAGLSFMCDGGYDAFLLDYRLGDQNGIELIRDAIAKGCQAPIIFLTGQGDYEVDIEAMRAGAADYLAKGQLSADLLERSVRYAIERKRTERTLRRTNDALREEIIERERVQEVLRLNEIRLQALWELSQMGDAPMQEITEFALDQQVKITKSEFGSLGFLNEDETILTVNAWSKGVMEECAVMNQPLHYPVENGGIWADAVRERKPIIVNKYDTSDPHMKGYPSGHIRLNRLMSVPVIDRERVVAVAVVANKEDGYDLSDVRQMSLFLDGMWRLIQRERAEKALRTSASLAAIGKALSSVAHDMKTPLIAIGGFTQIVQRHLDETSPDREKLDIVLKETRRLENMVKDMLDFSKPLELDRSRSNIAEVIHESITVVDAIAGEKGVKLHTELSDGIAPILIDVMRMKQVLVNLVLNAVQASPEDGMVTVSCHSNGTRLIIDVIDCGCGIPLDKRRDIFSPFVTTKKEGTGLGLPIVKKIVHAHNGYVEILDNQESGVTFRVALPID
jgi:two-component system, OmpR family, phosphate regulon sensor histidine kinase PhoR